jgi:hypothetical protein
MPAYNSQPPIGTYRGDRVNIVNAETLGGSNAPSQQVALAKQEGETGRSFTITAKWSSGSPGSPSYQVQTAPDDLAASYENIGAPLTPASPWIVIPLTQWPGPFFRVLEVAAPSAGTATVEVVG